ncbi:GNAT family N-acetyltransferase [Embleya sp. NBC_00896]|uniref:GNAT family N-acetyltransferase n=1 Tax=Embleya sp. NBC_00896 TaxID=2975961 RepID=UPI00386F7D39|nr:GNAT family N-acetyltransferase [Embleya sp. NBC_00896]
MPAPRRDALASDRLTAHVHRVTGAELAEYVDGIRAVYAEAFAEPPWNEGPEEAAGFVRRLADDARRPGFVGAVATAADTGEVLGFSTAWLIGTPLPTGGLYGRVAEALGPDRVAAWLCGALKVDELAVAGAARGSGAAAALLAAVTADAPDGRCWLITSPRAEAALRFYARQGWRRVTTAEQDAPAVLLAPGHPAPDAPQGA